MFGSENIIIIPQAPLAFKIVTQNQQWASRRECLELEVILSCIGMEDLKNQKTKAREH